MSGAFERATAVVPPAEPGDPVQSWSGEAAEGWDILGNANGGYLLAVAARAMSGALAGRDPVTITAHYLAPGRPGPLRIPVRPLRSGRRFATASAELRSGDDTLVLAALGTFGELSGAAHAEAPELIETDPPDLPPPEECVSLQAPRDASDAAPAPPAFNDRVLQRLHPDDAGFLRGEPSGTSRMRGWFWLPDDEPMDAFALLCVMDAFPPTVFNNAQLPVAWVPTLELTTHVRALPAPGPLACEFTTRHVAGGYLEEDGLAWDCTGRLVGQSRQLALAPRRALPDNETGPR